MPTAGAHEKSAYQLQQDRYHELLQNLLQEEANKYCSDCAAKGEWLKANYLSGSAKKRIIAQVRDGHRTRSACSSAFAARAFIAIWAFTFRASNR